MYPVSFELDYAEDHNRLTTFFRLIVAIPWLIVGMIYGVAAGIAVIIAWFAMLFTKSYPESLYDFVTGYVRFSARVGGYALLATDEYPDFWGNPDPNYPIRVDVAPRQAEYSRAKTFFKYLLAFPQMLILNGLSYVLMSASFVAWWRILFTGKQSATMHDAIRLSLAYSTRANSFLLLQTEYHPRLLDLPPQEYPASAPSLPPIGAGAGAGAAYGQIPAQAPAADPYAEQQPPPPPPPPAQ